MILREVNRVGEVQKNVPKLRFKGYEDNWKHSELGEVLSELYNGQTPSRFREENWNGDINWLTSGELNRDIVYKTIEKITRIGQVDANLRIVPEGIFVMAITGLEAAGTRGNCAILGIPTTLNQSCMALFPKENILFTGFLFQWYKKNGEKYGLVYTQGTKQRSYNAELIKKLPIAFPVYNEQKKISIILRSLDHYLTLYQNRIEELQKMKKTLLLKMFPKNGEAVPEIRFKGFTDAWEQRKLGEISQRVQDNDGRMNLPTLTISAAYGWMDQIDRFSGNIAGTEQKNYTLLKKGELSYNHGNSKLAKYGAVFELYTYEEALVPKVYHSFRMVKGDSKFIEFLFATKLPDRELSKLISSGARMDGLLNITYSDFATINLTVPSETEQNMVSNCLKELDDLITLHQRKLDELKNMKKTLLQQMFV